MAPNDVWLLQVKGTVSDTQHIHTLHFLQNDDSIDGDDLISAWRTAADTAYRNMFSIYYKPCEEIDARVVASPDPAFPAPSVFSGTTAEQTGLRNTSGDHMPAYMAALVIEKGTLAGRRYSGRFFIGGLSETDVSLNSLVPAYIAVVQAYCDALKAAFVTSAAPPWRLFCYSGLLGQGDPNHTSRNPVDGQPRIATPVDKVAPQLAGSPVANLVVSGRPTTMRSRKYGHGS